MRRSVRFSLLPRLLVLVAVSHATACSAERGPQWSERQEPLTDYSPVADLRGATELTFLVFGDGGTGKQDQRRVGRDMATVCHEYGGCDFALMAGDLIYRSGVGPPRTSSDGKSVHDPQFSEKFEIPYEPLGRLDFWAVPGNHDWRTAQSVDTEVLYTYASERWRMPAHDYAVPDLPEWIHIYGLATTKLYHGITSGQVERARADLCGQDGWRLLLGHHPVYSSGKHADEHGTIGELRQALLEPLIEPCGVQFYFAGHDHHQEHLSAGSFEQIIQGAAGRPKNVRRIASRADGVRQLAVSDRLGFALVRATPTTLEIRFFGHTGDSPPEEIHCRRFELSGFGSWGSRSSPCAETGMIVREQ